MLKYISKMSKTHLLGNQRRGSLLSRFEKSFVVIFRTVGLISIYYVFSIGITFYQKWFIKRFHYPLFVVVCHMFIKLLLASLCRSFYQHFTGVSRISLAWKENVRKMSLPGVASALDIGFSNWSFEFITISLYTMTKSTCIIFILGFAILFDLEKKRLSLVVVISFISVGLFMFTYKSTQFHLNGFLLVLSASMLGGLRWTLSQKLMQRKESSLSNPIDMMYHIQPWMLIGLFPLAFVFEVFPFLHSNFFPNSVTESLPVQSETAHFTEFWQTTHLILIGSFLAFLMEFSEYLLLTYTSSLTLSLAGIFKEMFTLYLAVSYNGDQMSSINFIGLLVCLFGIITHVFLKVIETKPTNNMIFSEAHMNAVRPVKTEEIETTRLLDDDIIHLDLMSSNNVLNHVDTFGAKSI